MGIRKVESCLCRIKEANMTQRGNAKFAGRGLRARRSELEVIGAVREYGEILNRRAEKHLDHMATACSCVPIGERFESAFVSARRFLRIARADLAYLILRSTEDHISGEPSRRFLVLANHASTNMWLLAKGRGIEMGRSLPSRSTQRSSVESLYRTIVSEQEMQGGRRCGLMRLQFLISALSIEAFAT
jgi:hypothetical protein